MEKLHRRYGLSDTQQKKLVLAGRAEIKRYFERAEELEHKLSLVRNDAVEYARVLDEINTPDHKSQDLFGERSLFSKVLGNTLTKEQTARYQALEQQLGVQRHKAALKWVLATWDQMLGLSTLQHERLEAVLIKETRPPRRFGEEDYFGVLLQVSRLPEGKLKLIFREDQWATLAPQFAEARLREPMLRREGYVPESDVVVAPSSGNIPAAKVEKKQG